MIKIRCVVERITYQNQENGYSVMKVKVKGYSDLVTLVGSLLDVPVGAVLLCNGDWKMDKRIRTAVCLRNLGRGNACHRIWNQRNTWAADW